MPTEQSSIHAGIPEQNEEKWELFEGPGVGKMAEGVHGKAGSLSKDGIGEMPMESLESP